MIPALTILGGLAFAWLALFQVALAAGLPWGHLAWGGRVRRLPARLRLASLSVVPLALLGVAACLQAGGIIEVLPHGLLQSVLWAFAGLFGLSLVANLASQSAAERLHGIPLTLCCGLSCLGLALWT